MRMAVLLLSALIAGCGPAYTVKQVDNRFAESGNSIYVAENNRVSRKSIAGGVHIDEKGMQINPAAEVTQTGQLAALTLFLVNVTDKDTRHGAPNSIGRPVSIAFLIDGELLTLPLKGRADSGDVIRFNHVSRYASIGITETGIAAISPDDLRRIAEAGVLAIKVTGTKRSATYENQDIEPAFRENLKAFYREHVAGKI